jgi:hypothetical protein
MKTRDRLTSSQLAMWGMTGSLGCSINRAKYNMSLPLPLSIEAEVEVMTALERGDDERLWKQLCRWPDEDQLLRVIAEEAPRMALRVGSGSRFSEMLLVPVVESISGMVIGNRDTWKCAEQCISDALRAWQGARGTHTVFRDVVPYEWIAAWEPSAFRQHLLAAAPGGRHGSLTFHPEKLVLPDGAPRLGFVVAVAGDRKAWPQLPTPNTLRDARFREVAAQALSMTAGGRAADVLPPDQVSAALADGLCLWLTKLHDAVRITAWDMSPCAAKHDSVRVILSLGDQAAAVEFKVRKHQVAPVGIHCVASVLTALAPRAPAPQIQ